VNYSKHEICDGVGELLWLCSLGIQRTCILILDFKTEELNRHKWARVTSCYSVIGQTWSVLNPINMSTENPLSLVVTVFSDLISRTDRGTNQLRNVFKFTLFRLVDVESCTSR
jgi:hypothetical protein